MKFLCPLVIVNDINKSRYLYETLLNQKVKADYGENITFYGDFSLHQKDHFSTLINHREIKPQSNTFELCFENDNLDTIYKVLQENNLELLHEIIEQPWKQRVIRFYDYDKNIIEVGERMEHVAYRLSIENYTIEEISTITYLTTQEVRNSITEFST